MIVRSVIAASVITSGWWMSTPTMGCGSLSDDTRVLLTKTSQSLKLARLRGSPLDLSGFDQAPTDVWGQPIRLIQPGVDGKPFDLVSYGADGRPGGDGEDCDLYLSEMTR